jgi:DNA-binding NarL/FixJ family response regulator/signal transduction histidine kinase
MLWILDVAVNADRATLLREAGFPVIEARNGGQALAQVTSQPTGVVVLDLDLPDLDGLEVCSRLRSDGSGFAGAILLVIPQIADAATRARALESGADVCLSSPVDSVELQAQVRALLRARSAESAARKRAEAEVVQTQKTFLELIEQAPFGIFTVDSGFRIAHMNAGSRTGAFRNVQPVIGRDFAEAMRILWPEPVAVENIAAFRDVLETGEPYYSPRFMNARRDIEAVEAYEWELHRMTLPDGKYGVICYYFDATKLRESEARRETAQAVAAERQRLYDVLETLPVYVALLTPDYHVQFANRFFRERFGESHGRRCFEYLFNRTEPCEICDSYIVLETRKPHRWAWTGPDTREYDIHDQLFIDTDGSPLILETGIDITERNRAERELQTALETLAARATQLRALASELTLSEQRERKRLAAVLHDHLQQLLIGAKYRVAILSRSRDDATREEALGIERLLDASISASRSLTSELSPSVLHEGGLPACLEWLGRWMSNRHGLIVDLAIEDGLPPLAEDVKVLLFESVRELLFNTVKHANVAVARVHVCQVAATEIRIAVSDDGAGFDPAVLKKAGETGGGFGLFSIRERLDMLGGRMEIDSSPGQGSRFTLTAPLVQGATQAPAVAAVLPEPQPGKQTTETPCPAPDVRLRVLLADDHAVTRQGLRQLLGAEPDIRIVGEATSGLEAIELASRLRPDVLLMDVSMPRLNGVDATRAIHNAHPEISIIGLSMFDDEERAHAMRDAGAVDYVTKSAAINDLIAAIRRATNNLRKSTVP